MTPIQSPPPEGFFEHAAKWLMGVVIGLIALVWKVLDTRIEKLEREVDAKADGKELDRQRDNIAAIFNKLSDQSREMNDGFRSLERAMYARHDENRHPEQRRLGSGGDAA